MNKNAVEEVAALRSELDALKEILNKIFDLREMPLEVRRQWYLLTKPVVESPASKPPPPEKGEAQQNLETIIALQQVFTR